MPGADPDQDGLANSIEFVLGTNPSQPTPGNALGTTVGASNVVFSFTRVKAAGDAGFASHIEFSDNLGASPWTPAAAETVDISDHGDTETVTVTLPRAGTDRLFARIRVIAP